MGHLRVEIREIMLDVDVILMGAVRFEEWVEVSDVVKSGNYED